MRAYVLTKKEIEKLMAIIAIIKKPRKETIIHNKASDRK